MRDESLFSFAAVCGTKVSLYGMAIVPPRRTKRVSESALLHGRPTNQAFFY